MSPALGLSPEARLLLLASSAEPDRELFAQLARGPLNWDFLTGMAIRSHATAALWSHLRGVPGLPRAEAARLEFSGAVIEFRIRHIQCLLEEVVSLLARHDIEVMLLKGAALLAGGTERPLQRGMNDVDFVVVRGSPDDAWRLCQEAGWKLRYAEATDQYENHHHLPPLADARNVGLNLEIHRLIFPGEDRALWVDEAAMARRARRVTIGGTTVRVPNLEDLLLIACLHFAWGHSFHSHCWATFADAHAIVADRGFSWKRFLELTRTTAGGGCCYWTLRLAKVGAGLPVPDEVLEGLPGKPGRRLGAALERHFFAQLFDPKVAGTPVTLRKLLWQLAVRPRRSGLGKSRPWLLGGPSIDRSTGAAEPQGAWARTVATVRYLWTLARTSGRERSSPA